MELLRLDLLKPFKYNRRISGELLLSDYQFEPIIESNTSTLYASSFLQFPILCRERESNPHGNKLPQVFETCASAIPPPRHIKERLLLR